MIAKEVNYDLAIQEWENLLKNGSLPKDQADIARSYLAGLKAEKNMAYYLDTEFYQDQDLMVFNNLKVDHLGRTAQIDHLVLSRWSAYFIETKSVGDKININADGQWARVYGYKYKNMESPVEQSRRHEKILFNLLDERCGEFMGKLLGIQKTFLKIIDVKHLVAITINANMQGQGKKAVKDYLKPMDQIPKMIADNHKTVKSSLLGSVLADVLEGKSNKKREPAFTQKEFEACCEMLQKMDISQTPLEQVHEFIAKLPEEAASLQDAPIEADDNDTTNVKPPPPICSKCGSKMVVRTARQGDRAGKTFYGCTAYPKCRNIINVD